MPICKKCGDEFPNRIVIDGKKRDIHKRKYCLECSPFGKYNPKSLAQSKNVQNRYCIVCGDQLVGKQRKYCSIVCKVQTLSSYPKQKERGIIRKLRLIKMAGGKCAKCRYDKNAAVLSFHHLDGDEKEHNLDSRQLSNRGWAKILEEFDKCILLCANCHMEEHYPDMGLGELYERYGDEIIRVRSKSGPTWT